MISIENLCYSYPDGTPALDGVSVRIQHGERVGLIGENGAGKSTLLQHLNGILTGSGDVAICGLDVNRANVKTIRRMVGLVFQNPDDQLFCSTVRDDVAFGPRNMGLPEVDVERRVEGSLAAVGLGGFEKRGALRLSVGEKRRVAIATVLAMDATIFALDEPTSNLDPKSRRQLISLLHSLGRTQIVATHDLPFVREVCDRVIVLDRGRIVADGPPEGVLEDESLLTACGLV